MSSEGKRAMLQGRIVWCSGNTPFEGKIKTDPNTKQIKLNQKGEQVREYGFGLAVPKEELQQGKSAYDFWKAVHEEAQKIYPNGVPQGFAWKYKDGDTIDHNGQPFANREGYKGCLVFTLTTTLPITFFKYEGQNCTMISEGIKCGDYVQVEVHVKGHAAYGQVKAGLYLNPNAVLFLAYGKEIINKPSGEQIFGSAPPQFNLPPGASLQPTVPGQGLGGIATPQPTTVQAAMPQPHYGVMPQHLQPPTAAPQAAMPQPAVAVQPQVPLAQHYPQPAAGGVPVPGGVPGWPQQ